MGRGAPISLDLRNCIEIVSGSNDEETGRRRILRCNSRRGTGGARGGVRGVRIWGSGGRGGGGPAGRAAAYEVSNLGIPCVVVEREAVVGGLSRTVEYKGYRFDIGGHRFYTKVSLVQQIWRDVLGDDLLTCKRLSRIYYKSRFFQYPLEPFDAIRGLGLTEALRCALSFVRS